MANQLKVQIEGIIHEIMPVQEVPTNNGNGIFKKQEIVILSQKQNAKEEFFKLDVSGEMYFSYISTLQKGDSVLVRAWVNGRKYVKDGAESYFIGLSLDYINRVD